MTLNDYRSREGKSDAVSDYTVNTVPLLSERIRHYIAAIVSSRIAGLALSILAGAALTAGTTYALVIRVQHLMVTASVSSDPAVWMQAARTRAYDPCYFGCTGDCGDPNYAYSACSKTATANVTGVICDGNIMWNWKDRYPIECLQALGVIYQSEDLTALKESYQNQLALIVLTLLGGLVGGVVVYKIWKRVTAKMKQRAEQARWEAQQWPRPFTMPPWFKAGRVAVKTVPEPEKIPSHYTRNKRMSRLKLIITGFLAMFAQPSGVKAYPCVGYDSTYDQYFVNINHTIFGVIHGWLSNCYDVEVCAPSCTSCRDQGQGGTSCSVSCTTTCWTETHSNKAPSAFVQDVMPRVQACGFLAANAVEGDVNVRVANAGIERNWWVRIGVNGYNVTTVSETDELVSCLHDIGN